MVVVDVARVSRCRQQVARVSMQSRLDVSLWNVAIEDLALIRKSRKVMSVN